MANVRLLRRMERAYPHIRKQLTGMTDKQLIGIFSELKEELQAEVIPALEDTAKVEKFESWLQDNLHFGIHLDLEHPYKIHVDAIITEMSDSPIEYLREFVAAEIYSVCDEKGLYGFNKCSECGGWFIADRKDMTHCSPACRNKAYRKRKNTGKSKARHRRSLKSGSHN